MKTKMKFIVMVFGVTLAIFGSMESKAIPDGTSIRCTGSTGGCVKVQTTNGPKWLAGAKSYAKE